MFRHFQQILSVAMVSGAVAIGLHSTPATACSVCYCGDPLAPAGQANLSKGEVRIGLDYEYLTARARSDDDPDFTEHLNQSTLRPVLAFNPLESLSLVVQIPLLRKDWSMVTPGYPAAGQTSTGLGDIDLGARLVTLDIASLTQRSRHTVAISAGSSLPTGANGVLLNGSRIDEHAQLGTGALAPYAGVLYAFKQDPSLNFYANVSGRARLTNSYGYKYGDALLWTLRAEYLVTSWLAFGLGIDGRYAGHDLLDSRIQSNTGGLLTELVPTAKVKLHNELWMFAILQIPAVTHLFGEQHLGPIFTTSLQYTFK